MNFEWRKPDGTEVAINHPDEITGVMNELKSRHENATKAGLKMEAAALEVQYDEQYKQWLLCMALYYQDDRKGLGILINRTRRAFEWWDEWSSEDKGKTEVSEFQRSLLEGLPTDLWPRSWAEAATIINRNPDFQVPSTDLGMAMQCPAEVVSIASSCLEMAGDLATKFFLGENPGQNELNAYQAKRAQLEKGLAHAAGL